MIKIETFGIRNRVALSSITFSRRFYSAYHRLISDVYYHG